MSNKITFWLVLVGLLFQTSFLSAQTTDSLIGVVLNIKSSQPIRNAKILLQQRTEFSTASDELGNFKLKFDPPLRIGETVKVRVEKEGFKTLIQTVQVSELALTMELTPVEGPRYRKWISLGVSLAAAGTAVAFFQAANDSRDEAEASRTESEFQEFDDDFHRNKVFTITFEIVSGVAGGYFLYEQFFKKKPPSEIFAEENKVYVQINPSANQKEVLVVFRKKF
jgi:hypothetical protein